MVYWKRCPLLGRPNDGDVAKSIEDSGTIGSSGYRRRSQPMTSQTDEERNKKKQCQLWGAQQERERIDGGIWFFYFKKLSPETSSTQNQQDDKFIWFKTTGLKTRFQLKRLWSSPRNRKNESRYDAGYYYTGRCLHDVAVLHLLNVHCTRGVSLSSWSSFTSTCAQLAGAILQGECNKKKGGNFVFLANNSFFAGGQFIFLVVPEFTWKLVSNDII